MNNTHDKCVLAFITLFLDFCLVFIYFYTTNTFMDKVFIYFYAFVHLIFYIMLILQYELMLDICHFSVFIGIYGSLLLDNIYLVILCLILFFIIKISFYLHNRCVLESQESPTYGYFLDNYFVYIHNTFGFLLFLKILFMINNNQNYIDNSIIL